MGLIWTPKLIKPPLGTPLNKSDPINKGLIGSWLMNEGSGLTVRDSSGNKMHGTLTNGPSWVNGNRGRAISHDSDSYIVTPASRLFSTGNGHGITLMQWAYSPLVDGATVFFGSYGGAYEYQVFTQYYSNGLLQFYFMLYNGNWLLQQQYQTPGGTYANKWYQYAITIDKGCKTGATVTWYLNGIAVKTATLTGDGVGGSNPLYIGKHWNSSTNNPDNIIDLPKIWNRALSSSEIQRLYRDPFCGYGRPMIELFSVSTGGTAELSGSANISVVTSGNISVSKNISGQSNVVTSVSGTIQKIALISGQTLVNSTSTGLINVAKTIASQSNINVTVQGSLTITETSWHLPTVLTLTKGAISSGSLSDVYTDNGTELVLTELGGVPPAFTYDFIFGTSEEVPLWHHLYILINGYYQGNIAHNVKLQQWDYIGESWDNVTSDTTDFPARTSETNYYFNLLDDAKYLSNGQIKLRINHVLAGNITHLFHIDYFYLGTGVVFLESQTSVNVTTQGVFSVTESISSESLVQTSITGVLNTLKSISSTSLINVSVSGTLELEGSITLSGSVAVNTLISGNINVTKLVASSTLITLSSTGNISCLKLISSATLVNTIISGTINVNQLIEISGSTLINVLTNGFLSRQFQIQSSSEINVEIIGNLLRAISLSSQSNVLTEINGNIQRLRGLSGETDIISAIIGNMIAQRLIQGSSNINVSVEGYLGTGVKPGWLVGSNLVMINSVTGRI